MSDYSLDLLSKRKNRSVRILAVLCCCSILSIVVISLFLYISTSSLHNIETTIATTESGSLQIMQNRDFAQYKKNKAFLASTTNIYYSKYLNSLLEATTKNAIIKSIQTQQKSEDTKNPKVQLYITGETLPSFPTAKDIISSLEGKTEYFSTPEISTLSLSKNDSGKDVFTFPLTLTLKNGNNSTQTK